MGNAIYEDYNIVVILWYELFHLCLEAGLKQGSSMQYVKLIS